MKNSTKLLSIAAILFSMVSCMEKERATATFTQGSSFEVNDVNFQNYIIDSLMFTPTISFDDLIFFNSSCDETNKGYKGGFKLSTLKVESTPRMRWLFTRPPTASRELAAA